MPRRHAAGKGPKMLQYAAFFTLPTLFRGFRCSAVRASFSPRSHCSPASTVGQPIPKKVLRTYFPSGETGFDPVRVSDNYSATVNEAIFERLLTYDYLARPAKLVPMLAEACRR